MALNLEKLTQISKPRSDRAIELARLRKQERNKKKSMKTMNMDNIFENAKFGDKFRTRDGRMAVYYSQTLNNYGFVIIHQKISSLNHACIYEVDCLGEVYHELDKGTDALDIIGKWEDEDDRLTIAESKAITKAITKENTDLKTQLLDLRHIDEEELDRLTKELYPDFQFRGNSVSNKSNRNAYKAGYRKAKEQI